MDISLRSCQPGQKLRLRNNQIATYIKRSGNYAAHFGHLVELEFCGRTYFALYAGNGRYFKSRLSSLDAVELLDLSRAEADRAEAGE